MELKGRPSSQDISWFMDGYRTKRLDLEPPYQRRSVWTSSDRKFFLDTIFRGYPCPPIFLHKTVMDDGSGLYHVVDGKQRLETIIMFAENNISISKDYGDKRLDGKKWKDLEKQKDIKDQFWNYALTVEMINTEDTDLINQVFDRLNRNARKLTRQELRHAKFDGWFISLSEAEAEKDEWEDLGISTKARVKRMSDVQFLSELLLLLLERKVVGFDQDWLDEKAPEGIPNFSEKAFRTSLQKMKKYVAEMNAYEKTISVYASGYSNFYSLWGALILAKKLPQANKLAPKYAKFMEAVEEITKKDLQSLTLGEAPGKEKKTLSDPYNYALNNIGAPTDLGPRKARHAALTSALFG